MHRVDQDSFARDIALELSGVWNKIDFCWQVRCPTCAKHHAKCADRKQARIIKGTRGTWIFSVQYVHMRRGGRLLPCAQGILLELMEVEVFRAIGMKGGKKFLRTRIASTTNQDLRDKDSSNFRTPTNFKYTLLLPISAPLG